MTIHQAGLQYRWMMGRWTIAVVWIGIWVSGSLFCRAADDTQAFVEGLRQQRYFDTATAYLQHRADNANLPSDVKAGIPYQQALVLIESAERAADSAARDQAWNEALAKLREFLTANPDHELASQARIDLAAWSWKSATGFWHRRQSWEAIKQNCAPTRKRNTRKPELRSKSQPVGCGHSSTNCHPGNNARSWGRNGWAPA